MLTAENAQLGKMLQNMRKKIDVLVKPKSNEAFDVITTQERRSLQGKIQTSVNNTPETSMMKSRNLMPEISRSQLGIRIIDNNRHMPQIETPNSRKSRL